MTVQWRLIFGPTTPVAPSAATTHNFTTGVVSSTSVVRSGSRDTSVIAVAERVEIKHPITNFAGSG
jgi:hypothetical protein